MSCFTSNYVLPHIISLIIFFLVHLIKGNPSIYYGVHEVMDNHFIYIYNDSWLVLPESSNYNASSKHKIKFKKINISVTFIFVSFFIHLPCTTQIFKLKWKHWYKTSVALCSHLLRINLSLYIWYIPHFVAYVNNY